MSGLCKQVRYLMAIQMAYKFSPIKKKRIKNCSFYFHKKDMAFDFLQHKPNHNLIWLIFDWIVWLSTLVEQLHTSNSGSNPKEIFG